MRRQALSLSTLLLAWTASATAQLISIRTVPISQAHQFDIFPSLSMAMGGVSIALADSLRDPFTNPAKGERLGGARFFGSPAVYSVSSEAGGGRTLPLGALARAGTWFGGLAVAAQEVDLSRRPDFGPIPLVEPACPACAPEVFDFTSDDRSQANVYAFGMLGKTFTEAGLSIGASVFWAGLHAIDGVDLLYPGSARLTQRGHSADLRVGVTKEWSGDRSFSALVLHNRFATSHDVTYLDPIWDPGRQQITFRPRLEPNHDRTNTWGMHLEYQQPLPAAGWRVGWLATTNLMSHPKIPNYEIQNIPRDPGNSSAFNLGVGISKAHAGATFGLDVVYEPIWSSTWADAEAPVETRLGRTIPAGGKTIENRFRFSNASLRMGFGQDLGFAGATRVVGLRLGLVVRTINYSLAQKDNVQVSSRRLEEGWVEWAPTWGLSLRFPGWEVRYRGSVTHGTGRPGVASSGQLATADAARSTILVAPSGPLTLDAVRVMTHQLSVSLPLR